MAKKSSKTRVKGSYCWCDQVQTIGDEQAIGFNCSCHIKGKKRVHTGTHITIQKRGR